MNPTENPTEQMLDVELPGKGAAAPFDRNDADFMLRSSDNVEFRVHRLILSMASFVFESMFSMPKPPTLPSDPPGIPEISIPEDSETLDLFLRICYPLIDPEVQTLLLLRKVLTAGIKYDAPMVIHAMKRELRQPRFMDTQPLRAFAIACLCDLEEEAKIAAEISVVEGVVISKASSSPEVDEISAGAYYRLLRLNRTRAVKASLKRPKKSRSKEYCVNFTGILPLCRTSVCKASTLTPLPVVTPSLSSPFTSLNHDGADIVLHTKDSVDFFVHRVIVTFASPTFLSSLSKERTSEESENQRPVYLLAEDSHTTDILLRMCYPVDHPDIPSSDHYLDVACAAHRYGFCKVEQTLLRSWSEHATNAPLRFYFAAVQCGWEAEARACARQLVTTLSPKDLDDAYVPEMESVSSVPYRRLLSYAEACRTAATGHFDLIIFSPNGPSCAECSFLTNGRAPEYPTTVPTSSPPSWLSPGFAMLKRALASKPCGSILMSHLEMGRTLLAAPSGVPHAPLLPTTSEAAAPPSVISSWSTSGATSPPTCSSGTDHKIEWVIELLQKYAAAVDRAVSQVELVMM